MNLSKKIVIGTLATGILLSPLASESHQADAATGETWNPDKAEHIDENQYKITLNHWISGEDLLNYSVYNDDYVYMDNDYKVPVVFNDRKDRMTSTQFLKLGQVLAENEAHIEKNKLYKMTTNFKATKTKNDLFIPTHVNAKDITYHNVYRTAK